jgi:hypothetical protein
LKGWFAVVNKSIMRDLCQKDMQKKYDSTQGIKEGNREVILKIKNVRFVPPKEIIRGSDFGHPLKEYHKRE